MASADEPSQRVRHRVAEGSSGLYGIENLDQAIRPLAPLPDRPRPDTAALANLPLIVLARPDAMLAPA